MRAGFVPALALSIAFNLQFAASQATTPATDQNPVIRSRAGEVLLDSVVRDKHHHLVNDLTPADVEVYEDGVRQDIKHFQLAEGAEELQAERKEVQAKTIEKGSQSASPVPQETLKQLNFVFYRIRSNRASESRIRARGRVGRYRTAGWVARRIEPLLADSIIA